MINKNATILINHKLKKSLYAVLIILTVIISRLFYMQILLTHRYYHQSQKNFTRVETISSLRGNIFDASGKLLATNRPTTDIYWVGSGNRTLHENQLDYLQKLESVLGKPLLNNQQLISQIRYCERMHKKFLLAHDISFEQLSKIVEQFPKDQNIGITTHFTRCYPHQSLACHLLGYLGRIDVDFFGQMGLEKIFETDLKGQKGTKIKTINSIGRNLAETELQKALAGKDIYSTIDLSMQQIAESTFPADFKGTLIIMDPHDGAIKALVSRPSFDPALFLTPLNTQEWQAMQEQKPFLNRAFNASYPPGSIFKLITLAATLEHDIINVDDSWHCPGYVQFAHRKYWCHNRYGHGMVTTKQALAHSCNKPFFEIGKKLSIDLLADYANRFGLGQKTNIIFAEKSGLVPSTKWKREVKNEKWWPGETLSASIGQSYLLVTPIQVACMIGSIFTGSLVTPRVLQEEPVTKKDLALKQETRTFLKSAMRSVVTKGSCKKLKRIKNGKVYAKTSTAQVAALEKRKQGSAYLEHAWLAAYYEPENGKPFVLVTLLENAGTSALATSVALDFLIHYNNKLVD
ncbi:penicillin-binding protein [Candidatus Dependentiae bacterium Noda2021]|nr:penicillin-binding protein [Candidatus Dependentiae bacterium Noda2021]